ncbi:hypothetical protein M2D07_006665 [Pseudomonas sp. BGr12]|uniref:Uncharacterized protein n=1 Tax=Pseudomonas nitroreducens TaxID=46680 RepID=A0A5R8ZQB1_PSENT|nr:MULTISPECIES: hypothetical protein [Pseudomonas]MDL2426697.1 hypothetical protein [Pseudomonas sp. BJa5]TLP68244.1 hypothetical protein FEA48_30795 [Pseudomonas nitroreducens]
MSTYSTGLRNGLAVVGSLRSLLANSEVRIYSGPVPATADAPIAGSNVLLVKIKPESGGFNFDSVAVDGTVTKVPSDILQGDCLASGEATFYRHVLQSDTDAASSSAYRIQGTVGLVGTDMELNSTSLISGQPQKLDYYSHTFLAQ